MPEANVRRRGMGDPEAAFETEPWAASLWAVRRLGRQKFRRDSEDLVTPQAFADPRLAWVLATTRPILILTSVAPRLTSLRRA